MWRHLSVVLLLFLALAGIVHYGNKIRANWLPDPHPPILMASGQAGAKSSVRQAARQALHRTPAAKPTAAPVTSNVVAAASPSENPAGQTTAAAEATLPATTPRTPPPSTETHAPTSTLGPHTPPAASTTHAAASVMAATLGPATSSGARLPTTTPSAHTPVSRPSTLGPTTGTRTQSSHSTALPVTSFTSPHTGTASEVPAQPTRTAEPTHPAASTSSAPGPTMAPQPSTTKTGTYQVFNGSRLCIKAEVGLELMVQELDTVFSPKSYFSIDPNTTQVSGDCGFQKSNLLVNFPGGFVNLTFTKDENSYYISEVRAYLTISNPEKSYLGMKSSLMMFEATLGHSFKCVSEQSVQLSRHLQLKMMNTQLQAFDFEGAHFGNVVECSSDYTVVLPVIGAIVLGLCAVGLIVYGIRLRRESSGYQRI
ncbi:lysosome-associated membrane glycoprotein 3 [Sorex fumeus]|uniref:lysosome-associated membrane glycoprotein 3 n=1 Tax=Sorex fumeus TaxID=62283 RepID=UPI0024AD6ACC|nr:lysosome-associated membrane glycoprotein 3 [Sorex fumeus]